MRLTQRAQTFGIRSGRIVEDAAASREAAVAEVAAQKFAELAVLAPENSATFRDINERN